MIHLCVFKHLPFKIIVMTKICCLSSELLEVETSYLQPEFTFNISQITIIMMMRKNLFLNTQYMSAA